MITHRSKHKPSPNDKYANIHIKIAQCNFLITRSKHNSYNDWRLTIKENYLFNSN